MSSIKEKIENHALVFFATAVISSFALGWYAHVNVIQQSYIDSVPKGAYVLKEDIDSDKSDAYIRKDKIKIQVLTPIIAESSFNKAFKVSVCKDIAIKFAKEIQIPYFSDVDQIWFTDNTNSYLVDCGLRAVIVASNNADNARSHRDRLLIRLSGITHAKK